MLMALAVWFLIGSPSLPFPLSYLQTSMCRYPNRLQWWLITEKPAKHFYPWVYSPVRQTLSVQRPLEYRITASAVAPYELYFPGDCLMQNEEEISHLPQTGTHQRHNSYQTHVLIQMNPTALPHQKPLGTGTIALDAHKAAAEQMSTSKHSEASRTSELLVCR